MSEKSGGRQFGGTFEKLFSDKRARIVVAIILTVLAAAALYFGFAGNKTNSSAEGETTLYVRELEERLSAILSKVEGAGKVSVAVNAASGKQTVLAMKKTEKITESGTEREETPLIVNGKTVVLKELNPEITGVLIVAEGANSLKVLNRIQQAVTSLLDIDINRIEILTMK